MSTDAGMRAQPRGKFFDVGGSKLYIRGVTYGTFAVGRDGREFPEPTMVDLDFSKMAENGINAVRTYTTPPPWLLDAAGRHGLRVMVGLPVERWIGRLLDGGRESDLQDLLSAEVRGCAGHPAVLSYVVGNEIPAPIVRWLGPERFERLLRRLYLTAKSHDPSAAVTYANYPSTEYLQLDFLDFVCFNVFLESSEDFKRYLGRLQIIAGERPLVVGEMGLDSRRHGEGDQARSLGWQVETAFGAGCAGAFVYAWTDEWHTAAGQIQDWDFGLVRRDRSEKPALQTVRSGFNGVPFPEKRRWPRASVIVCSYNGSRTIRDCLDGLSALDYPDYETIVVNDGSTDDTAAIAQEFHVRLISTPQNGLGSARNTGYEAATGEIVAYIDDDARPDPHWLTYLAATFEASDHAAVGGPNIAPPGLGIVSECVANAPGNPTHVLLTDEEAEHLPGCNMAFRRSSLEAIGGFDARYRAAGDDVDIGWRLRESGRTLGFAPAATVWHRPRASIRAYWKQQRGYGRAEALLETKWPQKYTPAGHAMWAGHVYGRVLGPLVGGGGRIYHGIWGTAPYQSLYGPGARLWSALPLLPEWYLVIGALALVAALGPLWPPALLAAPLLVGAAMASLAQAIRGARRSRFDETGLGSMGRLRRRTLITLLHLLQPAARLAGRLRAGMTPWRRRRPAGVALPRSGHARFWSEHWRPHETWPGTIQDALREGGSTVLAGGPFDRFDLEVRGGLLGGVRLLVAVEEHGAGRQLVRVRHWPTWSAWSPALGSLLGLLAVAAAIGSAWLPAGLFAALAVLVVWRTADDLGAATAEVERAVEQRLGRLAVVLGAPHGTAG